MYNLALVQPPPDWRSLKIASDIRLSQDTTRLWTYSAINQLGLIISVIIQVELTIVWNGISGLQSFSNLGQLIPFIMALGGLLKVLWGKGCLLWHGRAEELDESEVFVGEYEVAVARYRERKQRADSAPVLEDMAAV
ncbi:hypothetical protein ABVK25_012270 [Lepraria finkii]|uniref:Uncharacterized protein n=1 Tax=Lepraria finkii TaxID=1340010 RepID=A0ABR4AGK0_9LECA